MKKILFVTFVLSQMLFFACSEGSNETDEIIEDIVEETKPVKIEGTWEFDRFFVSFAKDGSYCSYLDEEFIDGGTYERSKDIILCTNDYFGRNTQFTIKESTDTEMKVEVKYKDVKGSDKIKTVTLSKTDKQVASVKKSLIGKSVSWLSPYSGIITMDFKTDNAGVKYASEGAASKYPLRFFYIFHDDILYHQLLGGTAIQTPTIGAWTDNFYKVLRWKIKLSPNGSIDSFENIK